MRIAVQPYAFATTIVLASFVALAGCGATGEPLGDLAVEPPAPIVKEGGSVAFQATVGASPALDPQWSASGGTIDQTGLYHAPAQAGTYVIRVTVGGMTAEAIASVVSSDTPQALYAAARASCAAMPIRATGTTRYFCDCGAGAEAGCVPGDDANPGTSPGAPRRSWAAAMAAVNAMAAGDTVAFCKGGAWAAASTNLTNYACRADPVDPLHPASTSTCDVRDYTPPTFAATKAPRLASTASGAFLMRLGASSSDRHQEGFRFLNLHGVGVAGSGGLVQLIGDVDDVVSCGNELEQFYGGIGGSTAVRPNNDQTVDRLLVTGDYIHDCPENTMPQSRSWTYDANHFRNVGAYSNRVHALYLSNAKAGTTFFPVTGVVRNNWIEPGKQPDGTSAKCYGAPIVAHGGYASLTIENNLIDTGGASDGGCWGISINDGGYPAAEGPIYFHDTRIVRNVIVGGGNNGITTANCPGCVIENNVIRQDQAGACILVGEYVHRAADAVNDANVVRNNTCYFPSNPANPTWQFWGIHVAGEGTGHVVANNAILFDRTPASPECIHNTLPSSAFAAVTNNACSGYASLGVSFGSAWVTAAPQFAAAPADLRPVPGSPLVRGGSAAHAPAFDLVLEARPSPPSIGALEP